MHKRADCRQPTKRFTEWRAFSLPKASFGKNIADLFRLFFFAFSFLSLFSFVGVSYDSMIRSLSAEWHRRLIRSISPSQPPTTQCPTTTTMTRHVTLLQPPQ